MTTATPNHSKRTYTIRKDGSKYRTLPMSKEEFNDAIYMTANDWNAYLKNEQPLKIK